MKQRDYVGVNARQQSIIASMDKLIARCINCGNWTFNKKHCSICHKIITGKK